jgi:hypothetical protein
MAQTSRKMKKKIYVQCPRTIHARPKKLKDAKALTTKKNKKNKRKQTKK